MWNHFASSDVFVGTPVRFNGYHTIYQNDVTRQCCFNTIVNILTSVDLDETNLLRINLVDEAPKAGI
jgi:hypothetical protein